MNEREKSLKLAELMGWETYIGGYGDEPHLTFPSSYATDTEGHATYMLPLNPLDDTILSPYSDELSDGLAQFAAILLQFPEVMVNVLRSYTGDGKHNGATLHSIEGSMYHVTQTNVLDEILKMNGVDIDK